MLLRILFFCILTAFSPNVNLWSQEAGPQANSGVAAVLETKPTTPAECLRAAKILADLERPDLARQFIRKVLDAQLDRSQAARLAKEVGSATFVEMARRGDLQPEGKKLADAFLQALNAELQDPQRIAALLEKLKDPSAQQRGEALAGLMEARGAAVSAMIAALADPARAEEHPRLRAALATMGRDAVPPLVGVLEHADTKLKVQAILALGSLAAPQAKIFLLEPAASQQSDPAVRAAAGVVLRQLAGSVPDRREAARLLAETAENYFHRRQQITGQVAGKVEGWQWDARNRQCVMTELSVADAARALAARLAGDAYRLMPEDPQLRRLYLMTVLEAAAYRRGLDRPLEENDPAVAAARRLGAKAVEDTLKAALGSGHPAAAAAAARLLGQIGTAEALLYQTAEPTPLVCAVRSPDRRVRMAALGAVAALKPDRPFAGSSAIPEALAFFVATRGTRRVLAAGPRAEDAHRLVSGLAAAGYQTDIAGSGREAMRLLTGAPDYELALIDMGIAQPPIDLLLQQIHRDNRSADVRVGLIARSEFFRRADRLAAKDAMAKAFARPHDDAAIGWQLNQLATLNPREFVGFQERQRQATEAFDLMAALSRSAGGLYDFRRVLPAVLTALSTPALSTRAIAVLANLGAPEAQRALVETASRTTTALKTRQAAAAAFRQNVQDHGILLTAEEIRRQYDRYNQSARQDPATQKVLGSILDCLEAPTAGRKP